MKNELASPMKCTIELNDVEKRTLQELALRHPYEDFRVRGQGLLLLGAGQRVHEIAKQLNVSKKTVYNWTNAWREKGLCGLLNGHKGGRPHSLCEDMVATAVAAARAQSMTLKQIAQCIEAAHGMPLPCRLETLAGALKRAGFSYKRGRYALKKNATNRSLP
ncbi:helix-turn-helix domain-containing protein [Cupriavidus sp. BIC8F]|uniref:helix-turn-helix domain-containing protein n=1 Tax=Cupriavidus sp. BIC8F TaxID=3079014 RepID=UPI002916FC5F|nr:helix-turn-helix domain-containing protein [Cupriavidus sp. BIC8F]